MNTYTFTCRQLFNVFGVRSIPNTGDPAHTRRTAFGPTKRVK